MNKKSILITGGGGSGAEAIYYLVKNKYNVFFADADIKSISSKIDKKRQIEIPHATSSDYKKYVSKICKKFKIDLLVPCVDEELIKFKMFNKTNPETMIMAPENDYIETMLDKFKSMQLLKNKGICVPKTYLVSHKSKIKTPFIIKPRWGRGSRDVKILKNLKDVNHYLKLTGLSKKNSVIQEKISGNEYTVTMVADRKKKLYKIIPVLVDLKKGITLRAKIDFNPRVLSVCEYIHKVIPSKSTYNIQLKITPNGKVYPFEINPRISTTFCLVLASGYNPFAVYLNEKQFKLKKIGNSLKRFWRNDFVNEL